MRILVATDGSEPARVAVQWVQQMQLPPETELLVVTVAVPPSPSLDAVDAVRAEAVEVAEAARGILAARWTRAEARAAEGEPRTVILQIADEWHADLLVLGARGLGAFAGMVLGSVSLAVAHHAPCPVLVTKGSPRPLRSAIIALDSSSDSLQAARFCAALPLDPPLRVRLLAVAEQPRFPSSAPESIRPRLRAAAQDIVRERVAEMDAALRAVEGELTPRLASVERAVLVGNPAEAIVEAAGSTGADLVVVGARGLGMFGRLLLGSVSEHVLRCAPCPVLLVKKQAGDASS